MAWKLWCKRDARPESIDGRSKYKVTRLRREWFGVYHRSCLRQALVDNNYGIQIPESEWETAQPGDFIQLWRRSGTGHSVIFIDWVREGGKIVGVEYWSTQGRTKGIGRNIERFGKKGSKLRKDQFYLCRVGVE